MSAANTSKLKANCDAVKSGHFITNQPISTNRNSNAIKYANHGAKLSQKQEPVVIKQETAESKSIQIVQQESSSDFHKFSDVQKVLKQEQELQKQLYSGSNVAPGWLRVNHNNKVIYIRWVGRCITLWRSKNHVERRCMKRKACAARRSEREEKRRFVTLAWRFVRSGPKDSSPKHKTFHVFRRNCPLLT